MFNIDGIHTLRAKLQVSFTPFTLRENYITWTSTNVRAVVYASSAERSNQAHSGPFQETVKQGAPCVVHLGSCLTDQHTSQVLYTRVASCLQRKTISPTVLCGHQCPHKKHWSHCAKTPVEVILCTASSCIVAYEVNRKRV